jgi:hypothetical protein
MKRILTGALTALTLAGALSATALPAAAADHQDRGWHGRGNSGAYRGASYRGDWHDHDRGWHGGGYGYGDTGAALLGLTVGAALAGGYAPQAYYDVPRCRIEMRWNPYWGGYDRVRVCY